MGTEFYYVGDLFNSRMNTVFKLSYQGWLLLAVASGFALYYLFSTWELSIPNERNVRTAWGALAALVLFLGLAYPLGATFNRTEDFEKNGQLRGLHHFSSDERAVFARLRQLAEGQEIVVAEAVGGDYWVNGPVSRVSATRTSGAAAMRRRSRAASRTWTGSFAPRASTRRDRSSTSTASRTSTWVTSNELHTGRTRSRWQSSPSFRLRSSRAP
jgi:uncharacterized membrane protein